MHKTNGTQMLKGQWLLKGGHVIDPSQKVDQKMDILIKNGVIEDTGSTEQKNFKGKVIDCEGKVICPGLMDMHVHLREPGMEYKETIESGCGAAMAGGFTAVACMPNTHPVVDNRGQVEFILEKAENLLVDVHPIGAVTVGMEGTALTEMGDMLDAGAVGFSDDGLPVADSAMMRRALEYASLFGAPIIDHCEDLSLSGQGVMHEGIVSTICGLKGIPSISEEIMVARDILLAEFTKGPLHIAHVSTSRSVQMIREAKKRGVKITAETCPHYLVLTDEAVKNFDTHAKMKPPLRTAADRDGLMEGLKDRTIDAIATDHAPHAFHEKETEFEAAAFGIVGLETALGLMITHLVNKKVLTLYQLIEKMSLNPRKILNLEGADIQKGKKANLTILDPSMEWTVDTGRFRSKSRNSPFQGWELKGKGVGAVNNHMLFMDL